MANKEVEIGDQNCHAIRSFIEPIEWFTYIRGTQKGVSYQTVDMFLFNNL